MTSAQTHTSFRLKVSVSFFALWLIASAAAAEIDAQKILADSQFNGGLIVQLGMHDAVLATELGKIPNALIHGLVTDAAALKKIRENIRKAGHYGRVSAMGWKGPHLPYGDNMVNLLVVGDPDGVPQEEMLRVLAPRGVAVFINRKSQIGNRKLNKPWPDDIDEWTHIRYDSTANAVSKDRRAGPPNHLQWIADPKWNRGTKTSCLVSARGRIFFILNDGHFAVKPSAWSLIARDAHNGVLLWRRPIPGWQGARMGKKIGPAQVNRRLIAKDDRVYATLFGYASVSVMDAATGKVIRVLKDTKNVEEFILPDGVLLALVNRNPKTDFWEKPNPDLCIVAVNPETGKLLWEHKARYVLPLTLTADSKQVVYHDGTLIRSLDLKTGAARWKSAPTGQKIVRKNSSSPDSPGASKSTILLAPQFAPTLLMYQDVVAFAGGYQLNVVSAEDGRELWRTDFAASNYSVPVDLFGFDGLLWGPDAKMNLWRPTDDDVSYKAYDLKTGKVKKSLKGRYNFRFQHHRCHQMKVLGSTIVASRAGIEFLDTKTGDMLAHHWIRGSCYYGVLPANGLLYAPPHNCACYIRAKLTGFMAIHTAPPSRTIAIPERLQKGPAFGQASQKVSKDNPEDWPTYRHDAGRSGCTNTNVPSNLTLGWKTKLGSKLTSPVIAEGRVYLAATDAHTLRCLNADTGKQVWQVTFDGRIDSPPTVHEGLVLCGCRDGSVHALRAADGARVWRFRASPEERLIVSRGQLESVWRVHGNVLVHRGVAYVSAGRTSFLDGGIRLYGLDPHTGKPQFETVLWTRDKDGVEILDKEGIDGFLNDVLSSNGERIFMRHQVLNAKGEPQPERIPHLHAPDGFLSSNSTTRLVWTYAPKFTSLHQGAFYDQRLSRMLFPSGLILVEGEDVIYGFGQNHYPKLRADIGGRWALFAAPKDSGIPLELTARQYLRMGKSGKKTMRFNWWKPVPIHVRAMVLTRDVLFVAGATGGGETTQEALDGKAPGMLIAIAPKDGRVLSKMELPSMPVWDGMAAANGKMFVSLTGGEIIELKGK